MKSYRFTVRFAGQRITHDLKATNDDEAGKNFITELKAGNGSWVKEVTPLALWMAPGRMRVKSVTRAPNWARRSTPPNRLV